MSTTAFSISFAISNIDLSRFAQSLRTRYILALFSPYPLTMLSPRSVVDFSMPPMSRTLLYMLRITSAVTGMEVPSAILQSTTISPMSSAGMNSPGSPFPIPHAATAQAASAIYKIAGARSACRDSDELTHGFVRTGITAAKAGTITTAASTDASAAAASTSENWR